MKRNHWLILAFALAALAAAAYIWAREPLSMAHLGTGFAAKQTCSCLHVSNRDLASCKLDYPKDVAALFSWRTEGETVEVTALGGLFSAQAVHEPGFGCRLVK